MSNNKVKRERRADEPEPEEGDEVEESAPKKLTRIVRILSVVGYLVAVSSAGVMFSFYYIFLWDPYGGSEVPSAQLAPFAELELTPS